MILLATSESALGQSSDQSSSYLANVFRTAGRIGDLRSLRVAFEGGSPRIAIVGDSIAQGKNHVDYPDSFAGLLESRLKTMFPRSKVAVGNFSIGGKGVANFSDENYRGAETESLSGVQNFYERAGYLGVPSADSVWPGGTVAGLSWRDHVRRFKPDLVVIAFGMNDTSGDANAFAQTLRRVIVEIRSWDNHPSIAVVTSMLPTKLIPEYAVRRPFIQANSDVARDVAVELDCTLIDANRIDRALRDGVDVVDLITNRQLGFTEPRLKLTSGVMPKFTDGPVQILRFEGMGLLDQTIAARDFELSGTVEGSGRVDLLYRANGHQPFNRDPYALRIDIATGQISLRSGGRVLAQELVNGPLYRFHVVARGAAHSISVNGAKVIDLFDYSNIYAGGYSIEAENASIGSFAALWGQPFKIGLPSISEEVALNSVDDFYTSVASQGGHPTHHPSKVGHREIYFAAFQRLLDHMQSWRQSRVGPPP